MQKVTITIPLDAETARVQISCAGGKAQNRSSVEPVDAEFVRAEPVVFEPVKGGWGRGGATSVRLESAKKKTVRPAMAAAWCNAAPKRLAREFEASL